MGLELTPELLDPREKFTNFYKTFQAPDGSFKYRERISQMASLSKKSLVIDFEDLLVYDHELATSLIEDPAKVIEAASKAILDVMRVENMEYANKVKSFNARFRRLTEVTSLRAIRVENLNKLVMVEGIVTRATAVKHLLVTAVFRCERCSEEIPVPQSGGPLTMPSQCTNPSCQRRGPFRLIPERSVFMDWQKLTLQERPEDLPPGQLPRSVDVIVRDDLVDAARPGDRVSVVGILRPQQDITARGSRLTTFSSYIEANYIDVAERGAEEVEITPEDEQRIKELAKDPLIHSRVVKSIAPSIHGLEEVKEAIAYLLFGGTPKVMPDGVRIRGDINVLLVGDPGTAKSQLLQYVAKIAPRGIYTSGRGSTAAGLTATVIRDKATGEFVLEAGALVLADGGVACIDEIDKMRQEDRVAIHEAMEQQTVSIAKAGIVAQLNARTSILAAANPVAGRYVSHKTPAENIDLPVTILSRFDLIFPITDRPDEDRDRALSEHILRLHQLQVSTHEGVIHPDLLKKYISYARRYITPRLSPQAAKRIQDFYLEMRMKSEGPDSPVPISPRQLEALIRLSEARAKIALRSEVLEEDADAAIRLMKFFLAQVGVDKATGHFDIDTIMVGRPKSQSDKIAKLLELLLEMERENEGSPVKKDQFIERAELLGLERFFVERVLNQWRNEGVIYEPKSGYIKKA